jgi:glycosyltransferase involved in cell wall biosynthesis
LASVAVAIPNFNGGNFLYETLLSLRGQLVKPDEIVLSDNYSTDDSLQIVDLFPDLNVKIVKPPRFLSMSENWNFVVNQTESDWFFLLSNDDLLRNTAIKRLKEIEVGLDSIIGVISFKSEIINQNSKLILGKYRFGKPRLREEHEFLKQNIKFLNINAASVAIKRESWIAAGQFPTEYAVLHDLVFYQRAIMKCAILECKEVLGRYRIYSDKPYSSERSNLVLLDFQTYENSDLKRHLRKYPDLLEFYTSHNSKESFTVRHWHFVVEQVRLLALKLMTASRMTQSIVSNSGFPSPRHKI